MASKLDPIQLVERYVGACKAPAGLAHWRIIIEASTKKDVYAEIVRDGDNLATIRICPQFWTLDAVEKRVTIAHELMHLHVWALAELVPDTHKKARQDVEERVVDTLAEVVAPLLPSWRGRSWR